MRRIVSAVISTFIIALFCLPLEAQSARPTFLYLLEGKGVPTGTIHVFSVNSSTGVLTEAPRSPFNAGLVPKQLVVDATGRFVYAINDQSQDITGFSVDPVTGALTELPGSPYLVGAQPVTSAVDPNGRFFYVFAIGNVNGVAEELLYTYAMDGVTGALTVTSSSPSAWEFGNGILITSMGFNAAGNYAYLGQVAAGNLGAPTLICAVDFASGALSFTASVQPGTTGEADNIIMSANKNLLYSINTAFSEADVFAVAPDGSSLVEISGSPYFVPYGPTSLFVHPSGNFLYVTNSNSSFQAPTPGPANGSVYAFSVNSTTGALTQVPGSPFQTGIDPLSIVVDPTGRFAYWTSSSPNSSFAQIFGASINTSSGSLTPSSVIQFTDIVNSNGAQLIISQGPPVTANPAPAISSLSPPTTTAGSAPFILQVTGANFISGSTVYFGGQLRSTTFISSTLLNANILASDTAADGTALVFVVSPFPGGGASASVEFPVPALAPTISVLGVSSVAAAAPPFALFVRGSNFVLSSVVNFNVAPLATTYIGPTLIFAEIYPTQILAPGIASISVTTTPNGIPGGGTSNTLTFAIVAPTPLLTVSGISPSSTMAGGPAFFLTVNGTGFVQGSQVTFNLNNVTTSLVSPTQLTALIPASALAIAGNPYVIVTNPGGSTSTSITFTINNPPPVGGAVTPQSLPAGSNNYKLNVTGAGFTPGSVVLVNGGARATIYLNSAQLQATLHPSDLDQSGTLDIAVMNPPPGGGTATAIGLTVAGYSVTPPSSTTPVIAGQSASFPLTISPLNGAFSNPVTLAISNLPAGTAASFSPSATIIPGAAPQLVTLSISTMARAESSVPRLPYSDRTAYLLPSAFGLAMWMAGFAIGTFGGRMQRLTRQLLLALLLLAAAGLVACTGAVTGLSSTPKQNPATGTPAGTYPIIVTATSGGVSRSATITLTVM